MTELRYGVAANPAEVAGLTGKQIMAVSGQGNVFRNNVQKQALTLHPAMRPKRLRLHRSVWMRRERARNPRQRHRREILDSPSRSCPTTN